MTKITAIHLLLDISSFILHNSFDMRFVFALCFEEKELLVQDIFLGYGMMIYCCFLNNIISV